MKAATLALGTVQLGMPYGITNRRGVPDEKSAIALIQNAVESGVQRIDTARAYGDAECRIGKALLPESTVEVVTKLQLAAPTAEEVEKSIRRSCLTLRRTVLDTVLLHEWAHYNTPAWEALLRLQHQGIVRRLGASVYTPAEALEALSEPAISFIQLPCNILDRRWHKVAARACERPEVVIQARSVLLQGILLSPADRWPQLTGVDAAYYVAQLEEWVRKLGRESRSDLCYAYVRSLPWLQSVVVGMERQEQLEENLRLFSLKPLTECEREAVEAAFKQVPEQLLNPGEWQDLRIKN